MTNQINRQVAARYEGLKFPPLTKITDPARNRKRGAIRRTKRRTIL
jgi:hypothetical protein